VQSSPQAEAKWISPSCVRIFHQSEQTRLLIVVQNDMIMESPVSHCRHPVVTLASSVSQAVPSQTDCCVHPRTAFTWMIKEKSYFFHGPMQQQQQNQWANCLQTHVNQKQGRQINLPWCNKGNKSKKKRHCLPEIKGECCTIQRQGEVRLSSCPRRARSQKQVRNLGQVCRCCYENIYAPQLFMQCKSIN